ncbi:MAG: HAMP domain-containing sensor histidine kinase [Elusimicrobia bacterium]|nr:HAMP domain-containing sensor histidine kinase [Elusimicrobiota bacterium]
MRLRTRLSWAFGGLAVAVLGLSAALTLWAEDRYLVRKDREENLLLLSRFAQGCGEALRLKSDAGLVAYVLSASEEPGRVFAGFFPPNGTAVIHSDPSLRGEAIIPPASVRKLMAKGSSEVPKPDLHTGNPLQILLQKVTAEGRERGVAALGFDPAHLRARRLTALSNNLRRIGAVSLAALAASVLLAFYLAFLVTRSVEELSRGARALASGDLRHRIPVRGADEVGDLAREFNAMAERLEQAERSREDFLSSMTHELRSPTASIAGYSDMLLSGEGGPLEPKQEEWAEAIKRSAKRLGAMINNLLDVAKLEAGLLEFAPAEVPLADAAADAADSLLPLAREKGVSIRVPPDEGLSAWADPDSVAQVFTNLLGNALKFTPQGGEIVVEVLAGAESRGEVLARVCDSGPGIADEALAKLFTRFYQAPGTREKTPGKGTGLGLYLSRRLIEAQGGRIWAENRRPAGAILSFSLPAAQKKRAA